MEIEEIKLKVCLLGDEGVGKTCLIRQFVYQEYDEAYKKTIGTTVVKRDVELVDEGYRANMMILDIMGRMDYFNSIRDRYLKNVKGVIAVFDLTRLKTLTSLGEWLSEITSQDGSVSTLVLANKADLLEETKVSDADIERFCSGLSCSWLKTSAKTGENVEKAFRILAKQMFWSALRSHGLFNVGPPAGGK